MVHVNSRPRRSMESSGKGRTFLRFLSLAFLISPSFQKTIPKRNKPPFSGSRRRRGEVLKLKRNPGSGGDDNPGNGINGNPGGAGNPMVAATTIPAVVAATIPAVATTTIPAETATTIPARWQRQSRQKRRPRRPSLRGGNETINPEKTTTPRRPRDNDGNAGTARQARLRSRRWHQSTTLQEARRRKRRRERRSGVLAGGMKTGGG
jgi:hypothetical protein